MNLQVAASPGKAPSRSIKEIINIFSFLAVVLGAAAGILIVVFNQPIYILVGLVGLIVFAGTIFSVEFGLIALVFITYTRISDIAVHNYGAPSVAKLFIVLLVVAILIRWAIFREQPIGWYKTATLVGLYGLVGFSSLLYAPNTTRVIDTLSDFVKDGLIAIIVVILLQTGPALRRVIWMLIGIGIFLGSISVFQYMTKTFTNDYGGFAQANLMQIVGENNDYRIAGPIGDPNYFGQVMVMIVPLAFERLLHERKLILRALAALGVLITTMTVIFTFSRGAFLAFAIAFLILFFLYPPKVFQIPFLLLSLVVVGLVIPPSYYSRLLTMDEFFSMYSSNFKAKDASLRGRASENLTAIEMFKVSPFFGVGLNNYAYLYVEYSKSIGLAPEVEERSAHNLYLEVAAETGIVGLSAFMMIIVAAMRAMYRARKNFIKIGLSDYTGMATAFMVGMIGYLIAAIFIHAAYPRYFYLLIGIALSFDMVYKHAEQERTKLVSR